MSKPVEALGGGVAVYAALRRGLARAHTGIPIVLRLSISTIISDR